MALKVPDNFQFASSLYAPPITSMASAAPTGASVSSFFGSAAGIGMTASVVSGLYSAISGARAAKMQARSQEIQFNLQADLARINARQNENAAQGTLLAGQRQEQGYRLKTAQLKSNQRASMAANGVDLGSDTAINILTTTDVLGEIDANTISANAVRSAWGYRTAAVNNTNQALMSDTNAMVSRAGAPSVGLSGVNSLLGSATSVASNYYSLKKVGAFG